MTDIKETIQGLYALKTHLASKAIEEHGPARESLIGTQKVVDSAVNLLKEQEAEIERLKRPDCEHAEHDRTGYLGYCGCTQDDEPIEACKRCEKYTGNISEAVKWDDG